MYKACSSKTARYIVRKAWVCDSKDTNKVPRSGRHRLGLLSFQKEAHKRRTCIKTLQCFFNNAERVMKGDVL
jgi:hypothetical protein